MTTSIDGTEALVKEAKILASALEIDYVPRDKKSIGYILQHCSPQVFVVNAHRGLSFYDQGEQEIFFHPNMALLRIKQLEQGFKDSLVTVCGLKPGMRFFDGTLGLASDALVAAYAVGPTGVVLGSELSSPLYTLTSYGLAFLSEKHPEWAQIFERLRLRNVGNLQWLKELEDNSVDVVYFDFMFEKTLDTSHGIQVVKPITVAGSLTKEHIQEAWRVAKYRIVAKSGYSGPALTELGFHVPKANKRKNFYYGTIEKKEKKDE